MEQLSIVMMNRKWTVMFIALACATVICGISAAKSFGDWSFRSFSGNWHIETGYLLDNAGPAYLLENIGKSGFPVQAFISGKYYQVGPMGIAHRWPLRVEVTNVLALPGPRRLF